jgi:hypothetical protein
VGNNPFRFQQSTGELSAGLRFDAPITRLVERNNYRQALITYQQARRALIQFEDATNTTLRQDMRVLVQLEQNLEIQREAVAIAIRRVDQTREALNEPPPAAQPGQPATTLGPTLANNLISALQSLSDAQNNFMSVYLQYYNNRIQLFQDLGIMRLDERGIWIEEPLDQNLAAVEAMYPLPPEIPVDWLRDAGVDPNQPPAMPPTDAWGEIKDQLRRYQAKEESNLEGETADERQIDRLKRRGEPVRPGDQTPAPDDDQPPMPSDDGEMPQPDDTEAQTGKKRTWRERLLGSPAAKTKPPERYAARKGNES